MIKFGDADVFVAGGSEAAIIPIGLAGFSAMKALDDFLASDAPLQANAEKLFQGPIADALTHVGQLCMLRRLAGSPVRGENYSVAEVHACRVGPVQSSPKREFS